MYAFSTLVRPSKALGGIPPRIHKGGREGGARVDPALLFQLHTLLSVVPHTLVPNLWAVMRNKRCGRPRLCHPIPQVAYSLLFQRELETPPDLLHVCAALSAAILSATILSV